MQQKIIFYGLLHINDNDTNLNFKFDDKSQKISIYFLNAVLLAKSQNLLANFFLANFLKN